MNFLALYDEINDYLINVSIQKCLFKSGVVSFVFASIAILIYFGQTGNIMIDFTQMSKLNEIFYKRVILVRFVNENIEVC